jgi:hypothetical protein
MSFANVGKVWSRMSFEDYVKTVERPRWCKGITLHHTGAPALATRPNGLTAIHIENIADFYKRKLGWSTGPHLFVDDDQIWGMSPLEDPGTHARSFNRTHVGIEILGEYDSEDPKTGRGLECWTTAAQAVATLLREWDLKPSCINFHRDDPRTDKTCPGRKVSMPWFIELLEAVGEMHPLVVAPQHTQTIGSPLIPVIPFIQSKGLFTPEHKLTRRRDGQTYLGSWRLETAHYDRQQQQTLASAHELNAWLKSTGYSRKA